MGDKKDSIPAHFYGGLDNLSIHASFRAYGSEIGETVGLLQDCDLELWVRSCQ